MENTMPIGRVTNGGLVPDVPSAFLWISAFVCASTTFVMCSSFVNNITLPLPQPGSIGDITTKYLLDPVFFQIGTLFLMAWVIYSYLLSKDVNKMSTFVIAFIVTVAIIGVEVLLEKYILKPSLCYYREDGPLGESFLTAILTRVLGLMGTGPTAAPSGFSLRQLVILLTVWLLILQKSWACSRKRKYILICLVGAAFPIISILRIIRVRHNFFDIGISVAAGFFVFWLLVEFLYILSPVKRSKIIELILPEAGMGAIILIYCRDARIYLWFGSSVLGLPVVIYMLKEELTKWKRHK